MTPNFDRGVEVQRKYYTDTAARYEQMHEHEGCGDLLANKFVHTILRMIEARSVLDVGTATGRGLRTLKEAVPNAFVCGVEPVAALLEQAVHNGNSAAGPVVCGSGAALPFVDSSFDVVCEFGVLHHVANPNAVVKEMLRVAKKAVLISDSNRFGQGSRAARLIKLGLYKSKLWGAYNYVRTSGRGYRVTQGDGVSYSYSVYDSFELISQWADRIIFYSGTDKGASSWAHPLLNAGGVLVCALKESP
ncbi:MAG: class I SAM-dependent methyltransferase [Candidatus Acidiferrum sp.]